MNEVYKTQAARQSILATYEELLSAWPVPAQPMTVDTSCGPTFVLAFGQPAAPPLILLHGAGSNSAMWQAEAPLHAAHFRVYAFDLPGEPGKSSETRLALDDTRPAGDSPPKTSPMPQRLSFKPWAGTLPDSP